MLLLLLSLLLSLSFIDVINSAPSNINKLNKEEQTRRKLSQTLKHSSINNFNRKNSNIENVKRSVDEDDVFVIALNQQNKDRTIKEFTTDSVNDNLKQVLLESIIDDDDDDINNSKRSKRRRRKSSSQNQEQIELVTDHTGQRYACIVPQQNDNNNDNDNNNNKEEIEELKEPSIAVLLQPLNNACFYRHEGWWTYEFCFKKHVRQYHVEANAKVTVDYSLGSFDEYLTNKTRDDENKEEIRRREASVGIPATAFHVHHFTKGTECDIGSLDTRKTEVQFLCAEDGLNAVLSIKEPTTCSYNLQFATPLLCSHEAFVTKEKNVSPIKCYAYKEEKEDQRTFHEIYTSYNFDADDDDEDDSDDDNHNNDDEKKREL